MVAGQGVGYLQLRDEHGRLGEGVLGTDVLSSACLGCTVIDNVGRSQIGGPCFSSKAVSLKAPIVQVDVSQGFAEVWTMIHFRMAVHESGLSCHG